LVIPKTSIPKPYNAFNVAKPIAFGGIYSILSDNIKDKNDTNMFGDAILLLLRNASGGTKNRLKLQKVWIIFYCAEWVN
jgi:hypothetical protein